LEQDILKELAQLGIITFNSFKVLLEQGRFLLEFLYKPIRELEIFKAFDKGLITTPPEVCNSSIIWRDKTAQTLQNSQNF